MTLQAAFVVLLLSIGANVDNLGVGSAYALAGKRIGLPANLVIGAASAALAFAASLCSKLISSRVSEDASRYVGGGILIVLGLWALADGLRTLAPPNPARERRVDPRRMRHVPHAEVVVLSFALAINAAAAGLAIGLARYPVVLGALCIGVFSVLAIAIGQRGATHVAWRIPPLVSHAVGGVLLVVIGVAELH